MSEAIVAFGGGKRRDQLLLLAASVHARLSRRRRSTWGEYDPSHAGFSCTDDKLSTRYNILDNLRNKKTSVVERVCLEPQAVPGDTVARDVGPDVLPQLQQHLPELLVIDASGPVHVHL